MKDRINKILSKIKRDKVTSEFGSSDNQSNFQSYSNLNFQSRRQSAGESNIKVIVGVVAVGLIIVSFLVGRLTSSKSDVLSANTSDPNQQSVPAPKASQNINKEFNFALKDDKGNPAGNFKYVVQSAETNDQIILKGQKNYSVKGREFLIINMKLTNPNKQNLQVNTRDYIRLSVNGNDNELLAPDIHNDPVEVQAIATEQTRVGFVISTTDKKLKLIIGEIDGPKTNIDLNLQ